MSGQPPQRLSRGQVLALKFAAHRQLARWANQPPLQPRQQDRRTELVRAVQILEDRSFAHGCELRATDEKQRAPGTARDRRAASDQ